MLSSSLARFSDSTVLGWSFNSKLTESAVLESAERTLGRSINVYNIRKRCASPATLCYDFSRVDEFLNRADIQADLGVNQTWESCTQLVYNHLLGDWVHQFASATGSVLDSGRRVVVYNGKDDYICNYVGGEGWTNVTQWKEQDAFRSAEMVDWTVGGAVAGQVKSGGGLTFLTVEGAGHMVPMDQPANALDILDHLVHDKPFSTSTKTSN